MSRRRDLKNAQAEVIAAAKNLAKYQVLGLMTPEDRRLRDAVQALSVLEADFDADGAAPARDTSIAASKPGRSSLRYEICALVFNYGKARWNYGPNYAAGLIVGGVTCDELERKTKRTHQSVSSAVNYCEERGWIRDSGLRAKTRSGCDAILYEPTDALIEWMAEERRVA